MKQSNKNEFTVFFNTFILAFLFINGIIVHMLFINIPVIFYLFTENGLYFFGYTITVPLGVSIAMYVEHRIFP